MVIFCAPATSCVELTSYNTFALLRSCNGLKPVIIVLHDYMLQYDDYYIINTFLIFYSTRLLKYCPYVMSHRTNRANAFVTCSAGGGWTVYVRPRRGADALAGDDGSAAQLSRQMAPVVSLSETRTHLNRWRHHFVLRVEQTLPMFLRSYFGNISNHKKVI